MPVPTKQGQNPMPQFIAFLRAINVGGHNVKMEQLRWLFESLKFTHVETFIASGNVIFQTDETDTHPLERDIESILKEHLGYEVATFLRTPAEVAAIAEYQPFPQAQMDVAEALNIGFVAKEPTEEAVEKLMALQNEIDDFHVHQREIYWLCRKKQSESTFSNAVFERTLKLKSTWRGINTIKRLAAKYPPQKG
jgi:uncharacterized protein (DUF1697 family)